MGGGEQLRHVFLNQSQLRSVFLAYFLWEGDKIYIMYFLPFIQDNVAFSCNSENLVGLQC